MMALVHVFVWSVAFAGSARTRLGNDKLYESLRTIVRRENMIDEGFHGMRSSIEFTFPEEFNFNCFAFTEDSSYFSERIFVLFQKHKTTSVTIGDAKNKIGCLGFLLFAQNLTSFKDVLVKLPRWSSHRVYGVIEEADPIEIEHMIEEEIHLLGDVEMAIFIYGQWSSGFKIGHPSRKFEGIGNLRGNSTESWELSPDGYRNFYGRELRFTTRNCSKFSTVSDDEDLGGIDSEVFREIVRRMNLTPKYVRPLPGSYLGEIVNGTWQGGVIGSVYHGHADVGFCGLTIESSKMNTGVQMSSPIQRMCVNFIVPRPTRLMDSWTAVFSPFSGPLILLLVLTIFFVSTVVKFILLAEQRFLKYETYGYRSWEDVLMVVYGMLLSASWPSCMGTKPRPTLRFLSAWAVFTLLMTTSFSSTLVSHLAKPKFSRKPGSVRDLIDMGYTWTVYAPFPVERLFNMQDPDVKEWAGHLEVIPDFAERMAVLKKSRDRVLIGADIWGVFIPYYRQPIPNDILDGFETMDACLTEIFEGFVFRIGSPYNKDFSFFINQLRESGLVQKYGTTVVGETVIENPTIGRLKQSVTTEPTPALPLSLSQLKGAFGILLIGHVAALAVFIGERIRRRAKHRFFTGKVISHTSYVE